MQHLISEFASENLLFIVYLIQFQTFLFEINYINHFNDNIDKTKDVLFTSQWKLPQNVPKSVIFDSSHINSNNINEHNFRIFLIFEIMFKKFLEESRAPLEINISHKNRSKLTQFYIKYQKEGDESENGEITINKEFIFIWKYLLAAGKEAWELIKHSQQTYTRPHDRSLVSIN